jgi:hypothetical protein
MACNSCNCGCGQPQVSGANHPPTVITFDSNKPAFWNAQTQSGNIPLTGNPANLTEYAKTCPVCKTDGTDDYWLITFIETANPTVFFTVWINQATGAVVPPVVGATDCPIPAVPPTPTNEKADGVQVVFGSPFTLPSNVLSFTVSAQAGSFNISFDGGGSFPLTNRKGSRTWGNGTFDFLANSTAIVIEAFDATSDVDVVFEIG